MLRFHPAALLACTLLACGDDSGGSGGASDTSASRTSAAAGATQSCEDTPACEGDSQNPATGCVECAVLGDASLATDGGACRDEYLACFGSEGDCSNGHAGCCAFTDCLLACPNDTPGTATNEFLDCVCDNDGQNCTPQQSKNTCLGQEAEGGRRYIDWVGCIYLDVCAQRCSS